MIKIALIDDHELVLQGLYERLKREKKFEIVGAFTEVSELLLCLKYKEVDVLVADLMLKDSHGFDLVIEINQMAIETPKVILLSGFYETMLHKRALDIGVKAFLPKESSYEELISTIFNVYKGNQVIPETLIEDNKRYLLTETELQVLRLISEEFSNERIAKELFISRRTVDSHVSNICSKLNVSSRVGAVREAFKLNLL